ncbi:MAG: nuclear transport factor 2 family protein [Dehalococcoidia bacterium]|nr:nuclear transport factor 2 family protein [Dehalococcoidia bacterium]
MKLRIAIGILLVALIASIAGCASTGEAEEAQVSPRPDIEDVLKKYAAAMDDLDKFAWLDLFSDNLESYAVYRYGNDTPLIQVPVPGQPGTAKQQLAGLADMMIFTRVEVGMSFITNVLVDVIDESTARAWDYFSHWEIVNPEHPANQMQGFDGDHWYFQEGRHEVELVKEAGGWKISKFNGTIYRTEAREIQ